MTAAPRIQLDFLARASALGRHSLRQLGVTAHVRTRTALFPAARSFSSLPRRPPLIASTALRCVRIRVALQQRRAMSELAGTLHVYVHRVVCDPPLKRPHVRIKLLNRTYHSTSVSEDPEGVWNEGFETLLTFHDTLFGTLTFDVHEHSNSLLGLSRLVGRANLRVADVLQCGNEFASWYELAPKQLALLALHSNTLSSSQQSALLSSQRGAIHISFKFNPSEAAKEAQNTLGGSSEDLDLAQDAIEREERIFINRESTSTTSSSTQTPMSQSMSSSMSQSMIKSETMPLVDKSGNAVTNAASASASKSLNSSTNELSAPVVTPAAQRAPTLEEDSIIDRIFFLSKETKGALKLIQRLFAIYNQGLALTDFKTLNALLLLDRFYAGLPEEVNTSRPVYNASLVELARHLFRFALAAYGWRGLTAFGKRSDIFKDALTGDADLKAAVEYLKIDPNDVLISELGAGASEELGRRNFLVAVDTATQSLILAVRGTMSQSDTLTDLACEYVRFKDGYVHGGIKRSADWFLVNIIPMIRDLLEARHLKKCYITGHSLGSAVAAMLMLMLPSKDAAMFEAFCFAPPALISKELLAPTIASGRIHSFVVGEDVVPRLSFGSLMDLKSMILLTREQAPGMFISPTVDTKFIGPIREEVVRLARHPKLFVPGHVYHIMFDSKSESAAEGKTGAEAAGDEDRDGKKAEAGAAEGPASAVKDAAATASSVAGIAAVGAGSVATTVSAFMAASLATSSASTAASPAAQRPTTARIYTVAPESFSEARIARNMLVDHLPSVYDAAFEALHLSIMRAHDDFRSMKGSSGSLNVGGESTGDVELGKGDNDIPLENLQEGGAKGKTGDRRGSQSS